MDKANKYIKDYTKNCSNDLTFGGNAPWISPENALEAVEIAKEETTEKVCKWLDANGNKYTEIVDTMFGKIKLLNTEKLIGDLRKAMKG